MTHLPKTHLNPGAFRIKPVFLILATGSANCPAAFPLSSLALTSDKLNQEVSPRWSILIAPLPGMG